MAWLVCALFAVARVGSTEIRAAEAANDAAPRLQLDVRDAATGQPTAARVSVVADGADHVPAETNEHGLRFASIHEAKRQNQVITYVRGTGTVEFALPKGTRRILVSVAKGFEYRPATVARDITAAMTRIEISLSR